MPSNLTLAVVEVEVVVAAVVVVLLSFKCEFEFDFELEFKFEFEFKLLFDFDASDKIIKFKYGKLLYGTVILHRLTLAALCGRLIAASRGGSEPS